MSGREYEAQRRAIFGTPIGYCDLCGFAVPPAELRQVEGGSMYADDVEPLQLCQQCWERIHKGELDVESLLIEEDERPTARELIAW